MRISERSIATWKTNICVLYVCVIRMLGLIRTHYCTFLDFSDWYQSVCVAQIDNGIPILVFFFCSRVMDGRRNNAVHTYQSQRFKRERIFIIVIHNIYTCIYVEKKKKLGDYIYIYIRYINMCTIKSPRPDIEAKFREKSINRSGRST